MNVHLIVFGKPQSVSRWSCLDPLGSELLTKSRDVTLQRLLRSLGRTRTPQAVHESVDRDHFVRMKQQEREQRPLLRPHGRKIYAIGLHLEPTQQPKLHSSQV